MKRLAIGIMVLASFAFAPIAVGASTQSDGYKGQWATTDCATWWEEGPDGHLVDCGLWGDGSRMTLGISGGETPQVIFQDTLATSCVNAGSPSSRWVGAGAGSYDDGFLTVALAKTGCGTYQMGADVQLQLYHDPGSDTLWEDEDGDGWGLIWARTR